MDILYMYIEAFSYILVIFQKVTNITCNIFFSFILGFSFYIKKQEQNDIDSNYRLVLCLATLPFTNHRLVLYLTIFPIIVWCYICQSSPLTIFLWCYIWQFSPLPIIVCCYIWQLLPFINHCMVLYLTTLLLTIILWCYIRQLSLSSIIVWCYIWPISPYQASSGAISDTSPFHH